MITLATLHPAQRRHRAKRVGRGNASGKGTTAGRGTKGQRARTGGRNKLIRRGFKHLVERTPKVSGWHSRRPKLATVDLTDLERVFTDGQKVTPAAMQTAGLIRRIRPGVKVLGSKPMKKKLHVTANAFSAAAAEALTKAGGTVHRPAPAAAERPA